METKILNENQQQYAQLTKEQAQLLITEATRVQAEREALKGKNAEQMIEFYLDYMQSRDNQLGQCYPLNKQEKTVKDCYNYIIAEIRKQAGGGQAAMVQHTQVFEMARKYFVDESIKKYSGNADGKAVATKPTAKQDTPEERKQKALDWEKAHKEKYDAWEQSHQKEIEKWTLQHQNELFFDPSDCPELKKVNPFANEKNPYLTSDDKNETSIIETDNADINENDEDIDNDEDTEFNS